MDNQVFRSNEHCQREQGETLCLDRRMASMNVSSVDACDGSTFSSRYLSPSAKCSFDHIVASHRSCSVELQAREDFEIPVFRKLSGGRSREIPPRDMAADSRDPEEDEFQQQSREGNDERTEAVSRQRQEIFASPRSATREESSDSQSNSNNFWGPGSSLKRANPIYESDNEFEEYEDAYPNLMRKRRCSVDRVTTAVYWQQELKSSD